jgi:hypothetical protein
MTSSVIVCARVFSGFLLSWRLILNGAVGLFSIHVAEITATHGIRLFPQQRERDRDIISLRIAVERFFEKITCNQRGYGNAG